MSDEISVSVASYGVGRNLMLTYRDPTTGKRIAKTSGTQDRREAERAAAVLEDELNTGRYQSASKMTWAEFRRRYEDEKLASLAPGTQATAGDCLNYLERIANPDRVCKVTAAVLSKFSAALRKKGLADTTTARHLRHIKAALRWGERMGLIAKAPIIEMPKRAKGAKMMKGRPITAEELDRMIAVAPKVRPRDAQAWIRYMRGLWLSGLRREESLVLSWDEDAPFYADLTGRRPCFRIYGEAQKSGQDERLPMTPDFFQFLTETPAAERVGRVFKLTTKGSDKQMVPGEVGRLVSLIGKKAGVVVDKAAGKFGSCHDLRRSFGSRWASKVKPATLQKLMRHSTVLTSMTYYVALDADDVADELWATWGATVGNTPAVDNTCDNTEPKAVKVGHA